MKKQIVVFMVFMLYAVPAFAALDRFAIVPSEGDNNINIVDLNTEKTVKTLSTGKTPHAIAFTKEGKGYVNNRGSKDLTVIDGFKMEVLKTIALPATSFQLALSPDNTILAVAYKDALKVSLIETATDLIKTTIAIGKEPESPFKGAMMKHPYWTKDGAYVYVSDNVNCAIIKLDVKNGAIAATINLPGPNHYLHPSPDGKFLYAVNEAEKTGTSVTLIDCTTDKVVKDIPIPLEAGEQGLLHHGDFTKDGKFFFVCNEGGKTIAIVDTSRQEVVKTLKSGMGAGHPGMTRDGKFFFVIHHKDNVITVIEIAKQELVKSIATGAGKKQAHGGYFTPDGKYYYMINAEDNNMVKIDVAKMEVVSNIPVGKSAMFFSIREGNDFPSTE